MLLTEELVMGQNNHYDPKHDPKDDPSQDQEQTQANLQAQLQAQANLQAQGQGQGQGQGQSQGQDQYAVQGLWSSSENYNGNGNLNGNANFNSNDNKLDNDVDNKVESSLDSKVDNDIDNKIENEVRNEVETNVDVKVDIELGDLNPSSPVIDLSHFSTSDSLIMPDVVTQTLTGDGNIFNVDQVNYLINNDTVNDPDITFNGGGGGCCPSSGFHMDAKIDGGYASAGGAEVGDIVGNAASGVTASADASLTQDAFTQTITTGANIQFNSLTMNVAGSDFSDDHSLG
jgi:hypothetical protein